MKAAGPRLWHLPTSQFSEKVRWALDYKGVEHRRRTAPPGMHMFVALWKTRGRVFTFPVLELDGSAIGDSTAIIAALEERVPEPALYPSDSAERRRALELEEWFDTELGPYIRRFVFNQLAKDPEKFAALAAQQAPPPFDRLPERFAGAYGRAVVRLRFGTGSEKRAEAARTRVVQALERLERELDGNDYLVGDRFTVADLTAASLLYPLVLPPEGPTPAELITESLHRFRAQFEERPGYRWIGEMFRRHRQSAVDASSNGSGTPLAAPASTRG